MMEKFRRQGNSLTSFVCLKLSVGLIEYGVGTGAYLYYLLAPAMEVSLPPMWYSLFARLPPHRTLCRSWRFFYRLPPCRNNCLPIDQAHYNRFAKGSSPTS